MVVTTAAGEATAATAVPGAGPVSTSGRSNTAPMIPTAAIAPTERSTTPLGLRRANLGASTEISATGWSGVVATGSGNSGVRSMITSAAGEAAKAARRFVLGAADTVLRLSVRLQFSAIRPEDRSCIPSIAVVLRVGSPTTAAITIKGRLGSPLPERRAPRWHHLLGRPLSLPLARSRRRWIENPILNPPASPHQDLSAGSPFWGHRHAIQRRVRAG